jgi:hypothetical protein
MRGMSKEEDVQNNKNIPSRVFVRLRKLKVWICGLYFCTKMLDSLQTRKLSIF